MSEITTPRIFEYITRSTWLHFEDSLQIGKVKLFAGKYRNGGGAAATLNHYLDTAAARPIFHDMLWSKPIETKDYKGGRKDGRLQSRVLSINTAEKGYYFEISHGPGKETKTGAVQPAGQPETSINVFIPFHMARQIAAECLEYLAARRTVDLMMNYPTELLAQGETVSSPTPATIANSDDAFDETFPREPDYAGNAELHKYQYTNGEEAPENARTRAIYDAYFEEFRKRPKDGRVLKRWYEKNKPAETAPAEA